MAIEIKQVLSKRDVRRFIRTQRDLLREYPGFVPPLEAPLIRLLYPPDCPFRDTAEHALWIAWQDGRPVGRVAALINRSGLAPGAQLEARFGWFDYIDDPAVASALLRQAESWARERGAAAIRGPMGFTALDAAGMLTEGFDYEGGFTTLYNPSYYPGHLEASGYQPEAEWIQYEFPVHNTVPDRINRLAEAVEQRFGLEVSRPANRREMEQVGLQMMKTYQVAFEDIYQSVPLTDAQTRHYIRTFMAFFSRDLSCFVRDRDGEVIGFALTVPSLAKALRKANGRIFPFGWWHLRQAFRKNDTVELLIIGVHRDYQSKGVPAVLFRELWQNIIRRGFRRAIANPELTDNHRILNIWQGYEKKKVTTRKTFVRQL